MDKDFLPPPNFGDMLYGDFHSYDEPTVETGEMQQVTDIPDDIPEVPQYELPSYVGGEWVPNETSDLAWYQKKYADLINYTNSEEFTSILAEQYKGVVSQQDERLVKYKDVVNALEGGDTLPLKLYFPEKLTEMGISPVLSESELDGLIEDTMKKEFGDDYQSIYSERDALRPSSVSAKMMSRTMELQKQYAEENKGRLQAFETFKQQIPTVPNNSPELTPEQYYETVKDQLSKEEYDALLPQIQEGMNKWSLLDLRKIITYDDDIKAAEERGRTEGRNRAMGEVRGAGALQQFVPEERKERKVEERRPGSTTSAWKDFLMGNLINGQAV